MARQEQDKEDLIRDATGLVERAEIRCADLPQLITIGFFRDDRFAVYFDQDPFYRFTPEGRLRRAFEAGFLYRSQGDTLARIHRRRVENHDGVQQVVLDRTDLNPNQLDEFRQRMRRLLTELQDQLERERHQVLRAVTPDGGVPHRTLEMLARILDRRTDDIAAPAAPR